MQLASVYYGSTPIKHSSIRATLPDKSKAETLVIGYDGANNYRFTNDGKYTEIVTYKDGQCSAVAALIANNTSTLELADKQVLQLEKQQSEQNAE